MSDFNQLFKKATQQFQNGRIKDANKTYKKIVKQAPDFIDARNMLGITHAQLGELPAAADQFSKLIKLEPNKPGAYENAGRVYMQMQAFEKAQEVYEIAITLDPKSYALYFGLGGALMSQNNFEAALKSFNLAQSIDASQAMLFTNTGTVLSQLGRTEQAVEAFNRAYSLDQRSAIALMRLGQLYIQNNKFILAEEILIKADSIQPNNFEINLSLADAYQHNGKIKLAIQHYFSADKISPQSQNIYTKLDKLILHFGSDDKKKLLEKLTQESVYKDWTEAIDDARKIADLQEYHDETAISCLRKFFDEYHPDELHPREWWQKKLSLFGGLKDGHDKILRGVHSAVFSWSIPDKQTLSSIAEFVNDTRLYSYGAGSALWERLLSEHFNLKVTATDFMPRHSYLPIAVEDYSKSKLPENDTIFLAWIIRGDTGVLNLLKQFKSGQKLVLVGEPPDDMGIPRICGTPEMFSLLAEDFILVQSIPLVSYSMLNDTVSLYIKK